MHEMCAWLNEEVVWLLKCHIWWLQM